MISDSVSRTSGPSFLCNCALHMIDAHGTPVVAIQGHAKRAGLTDTVELQCLLL